MMQKKKIVIDNVICVMYNVMFSITINMCSQMNEIFSHYYFNPYQNLACIYAV